MAKVKNRLFVVLHFQSTRALCNEPRAPDPIQSRIERRSLTTSTYLRKAFSCNKNASVSHLTDRPAKPELFHLLWWLVTDKLHVM